MDLLRISCSRSESEYVGVVCMLDIIVDFNFLDFDIIMLLVLGSLSHCCEQEDSGAQVLGGGETVI